jgi:hypothetical protein
LLSSWVRYYVQINIILPYDEKAKEKGGGQDADEDEGYVVK